MKPLIFGILFVLLFYSCTTVKIAERQEYKKDQPLTKDNFKVLSGAFFNTTTDSANSEQSSLWQTLFPSTKFLKNWEQAKVKFESVTSQTMTAKIFLSDSLLDTKTIHFKFKNGYLALNRQVHATMKFGPLLWGISDTKIYIGLTENNDLTSLVSRAGIGLILFIPGFSSGGQYDAEYKRIK